MAEQLFCKQLVGGSIPFAGSNLRRLQPGGRLWLESGIGQGSSFHLSLPITGLPAPAARAEQLPAMVALLQK
jgi:hypothetical protein